MMILFKLYSHLTQLLPSMHQCPYFYFDIDFLLPILKTSLEHKQISFLLYASHLKNNDIVSSQNNKIALIP